MKYLLTGGAGFIGSHLAEELLRRGNEVCVVDDLSTGQIRNVQHLKEFKAFQCIIDSVMNRQVMAELVDDADLILHLAAAVGVQLVVDSPIRTIETNIKGTEIVLELAAKKGKRIVIFSTSEVYGKSTQPTFSESHDLVLGPTTRGRWSYAASKIIDEFLALAYFKEKRLPITIVRLFNTVGPRQTGRYGMVVPRFVEQAQNAMPITVYGNGRQSRTFIHVHDTVRAILALTECDRSIGEVFNIGGTETISIAALASLVKDLVGTTSPITYVPYDKAYETGFEDMESRVPDIRKLQEQTGFEPQRTLREIILDVAEYQKQFALPDASPVSRVVQ